MKTFWGLVLLLVAWCNSLPASRDVIIGICGGILPIESTKIGMRMFNVRVFLGSLRQSGSSAHVVLFTDKDHEEFQSYAESMDAEVIVYHPEQYTESHGQFAMHRFRLFREFLEARMSSYDRVMLCDIRDVLFQDDPFMNVPVNNGLAVAIENEHTTIGTCFWHSLWFKTECLAYAKDTGVYNHLKDFPRSCCGTTLGTTLAMYKYIIMMDTEMFRVYNPEYKWWCAEQAPHNYLLWGGFFERQFNVTKYAAETSHLCTFGDYRFYNMSQDGLVLNLAGFAPAIVHQYDRSPHLTQMLYRIYGEGDWITQEFCTKHPKPENVENDFPTFGWKEGQCYHINFGQRPPSPEETIKEEL